MRLAGKSPACPCAVSSAYAESGRAFTLIEMVVVVTIILIIVGLVLPAASTLWGERKLAQTVNAVQGLLMTSRADATATDGVETGFLSFVDDDGTQHLVAIEQDRENVANLAWQNVFVISDDPDQLLPAPIRVVPRYVVDNPGTPPDPETFSGLELVNNDFKNKPDDVDEAQRHRNFFTVVFTTDGHLLVNRDVLIYDVDADMDGQGDRTGLPVGPGPPDDATTTQYYTRAGEEVEIDPDPNPEAIPFLVIDVTDSTTRAGVAINIPSIDGLLVYDDSLFSDVTTTEKRPYLLRTSQPLFVSRWTGTAIRGSVGEMAVP